MKFLSWMGAALVFSTSGAFAENIQKAVFAGGCFWCVESDFESVKGVKEVVSGYTGGKKKNPTYKTIGDHIEAVEVTFDADTISYDDLLHKFFRSVDPTDAGGQFCDRGKNYATAIFALDGAQRKVAKIAKSDAAAALGKKVVTPIKSATVFYPAENYHQNYYKSNEVVLTRFGPSSKAKAYKRYRKACGRDAKVKQLWGKEAAFLH